MARVLPVILIALLMIYCVVQVAQANSEEVRKAPRWVWAVAVICLPGIGSIAWLIWGRPVAVKIPPRKPKAPDDDPDWLRKLH